MSKFLVFLLERLHLTAFGRGLKNMFVWIATNFVNAVVGIQIGRWSTEYWRIILGVVAIVALLICPFLFAAWKRHHLTSYALLELIVAMFSIVMFLPWDRGIFNIESYTAFLTPAKTVALFTAMYFAVRGVENLKKGLAE
ncbi:MAG: hypothetical protein HOP34_03180 [Methylococcaceae bacterium]|nr:hypothetical protein [Methylococcaceae bacterium]